MASSVVGVWPQPQTVTSGLGTAWIDAHSFTLLQHGTAAAASPALAAAFARYRPLLFPHRTPASGATSASGSTLAALTVRVHSATETTPRMGVDESYKLTVARTPHDSEGWAATIEAPTLFGAYHGLGSFSQLVTFDFDEQAYRVNGAPLRIVDAPRSVR